MPLASPRGKWERVASSDCLDTLPTRRACLFYKPLCDRRTIFLSPRADSDEFHRCLGVLYSIIGDANGFVILLLYRCKYLWPCRKIN